MQDIYRPRSEGDNVIGSVRPSVCPSACPSVRPSVSTQGQRSRSNFWRVAVDIRGLALPCAAKGKEESLSVQGVNVCVSNSRADAVDRLLIFSAVTSPVCVFLFVCW